MPVLADQPELTTTGTGQTQDVVWKTCQERWMIVTNGERERESEKSEWAAQYNDEDDIYAPTYTYIYIYIYIYY